VQNHLRAFAIHQIVHSGFLAIFKSSLMHTKSRRFTPHLYAPDLGTGGAVTLRHAASVRPCARPLYGQEQAAKIKKKNKRKER